LTTQGNLVGQVIFKNVGKLPATEVVSVVKKIEVHATWSTPALTDADLPSWITGVIPIGGEVPQGSEGIALNVVNRAKVSGGKYLYVYGPVRFKDGFGCERHVDFCHRYPWAKATSGGEIPKEFARYHQYGNRSD
jgi:hypothetical protein